MNDQLKGILKQLAGANHSLLEAERTLAALPSDAPAWQLAAASQAVTMAQARLIGTVRGVLIGEAGQTWGEACGATVQTTEERS